MNWLTPSSQRPPFTHGSNKNEKKKNWFSTQQENLNNISISTTNVSPKSVFTHLKHIHRHHSSNEHHNSLLGIRIWNHLPYPYKHRCLHMDLKRVEDWTLNINFWRENNAIFIQIKIAGKNLLDAHSSIFISQCDPVNPGTHLHVYLLIPSMQVAPFRHGSKDEKNWREKVKLVQKRRKVMETRAQQT